jgi:hypothetical protein
MNHIDKEDLAEAVALGMQRGARALLDDKDLVAEFWKAGYSHLTVHAGNGASQWVGKRILTAIIGALFVWAMAWLVKEGALK